MGAADGGGRAAPGTGAAPLEIREVHSRRDLDRFAKFAAELYVHDPQWVAPLLLEVKEFLNRKKHPFYLHGDAAMFLALRSGRPVGRILVSDDPNYNAFHHENLGCFGKFESVDDPQVSRGLLDAATEWLRKRGRTEIRGPIDYSMNYPCGLLIDGFDTPPQVMMNHNPPYYAGLLESWGLAKVKDLYAWWFEDPYDMLAEWRSRVEWLAKRGRVTVRPFRRSEFHAEVKRCNEIYSTAYKDNWGFVPLTDAEFEFLAKQLNQIAHEKQVLLAEADGKTVGFSITLPDMNEAIRPLGGRLTTFGIPIGLVRLLWRMRKVKSARMLVLVVRQEYRRRGVSELLILNTLEFGKKILGYTAAELGWTLEDNYLINRTVERVGAKRYKTYRLYEKKL